MKKILILVSLILFCTSAHAQDNAVQTYSEENKFGLIKNEQKITEAKYNKLIRLKDSSWLFLYKNKFGIMDNDGNILVEPKFTQAQRYVGRFAKLGSKGLYCLFDENANLIIPQEYSAIEILYGKMFLVEKNYKYGLISYNGDIILAPVAAIVHIMKYHFTWPSSRRCFLNFLYSESLITFSSCLLSCTLTNFSLSLSFPENSRYLFIA